MTQRLSMAMMLRRSSSPAVVHSRLLKPAELRPLDDEFRLN